MLKRVVLCLPGSWPSAWLSPRRSWPPEPAPSGAGDINPLAPSAWKLDLALWTAVVFLCLLAILGKFAWKPLMAGLDKREHGIADQIAQAEAANQQAKQLLADYQRKLADAKDEVRGIVEQGRRDAEKLGHELLDKAKEEARAEHARAVQQIEAATDAAVKDLADRSAAMAVELAGKIVGAKLNPADHARLIEQAIGGNDAVPSRMRMHARTRKPNDDSKPIGRVQSSFVVRACTHLSFDDAMIDQTCLNPATSPPNTPAPRPKWRPRWAPNTSPTFTPRRCSDTTERAGQTEAVVEDFDAVVAEMVGRFPKLEAVLDSILVSPEEKAALIDKILGGRVSPAAGQFPQGRGPPRPARLSAGDPPANARPLRPPAPPHPRATDHRRAGRSGHGRPDRGKPSPKTRRRAGPRTTYRSQFDWRRRAPRGRRGLRRLDRQATGKPPPTDQRQEWP